MCQQRGDLQNNGHNESDESIAIQYHSALSIPGPKLSRPPDSQAVTNYCLQFEI